MRCMTFPRGWSDRQAENRVSGMASSSREATGTFPPALGWGRSRRAPMDRGGTRGSGRPAHQTKAVKDSIQTPEGDAKPKSGLGLEGGEGTGYPGGLRGRNR